ncbi:hypothetical protein [Synechocystis salina]|uniref:Uncharacterized protein n=1 Tax=Synechocystis salina LEGE 00031 TaxID=1828736 RepID=A0ABR9VUC5_9SYNC|nr:hypothetical protein [Synechocystis salina]MBE9241586.1 hypothetical protein [Synechocystis salina LEGE 00041]MBE9254960.1 hypothetical protein [Synechocystis salina LEGE 00031]
MPDFQAFIAIITTILVFVTGVALKYETIQFKNYELPIPQWAGLSFAGVTFTFVVLDQILRGFVRLEEVQRRDEERNRRDEEARARKADAARTEDERIKATERETRRTRIETRYRTAIARFQLDPSPIHRTQLADILALLEEYQDTL